jgi:class 3 adenylate cyclase
MRMKSSNLAIVFVDIAGFTERTGKQSREESEAWLRRYQELLLPLVRAFGGRKVKSIGDAYLCTFESPTNAVLFGMAAQDRLFAYNQTVSEPERIDIRVALNVGEVRLRRKDVFGEPVNIAARVEGLTPPGEIWFTEAVYLAMTKSEVPAEEVGLRELRGISEPVRLYRVPRGPEYQLSSRGGLNGLPKTPASAGPEPLGYPYGGIGLCRAEQRGWVMTLAGLQGKLSTAGGDAVSVIGQSLGRLRASSATLTRTWALVRAWPLWAKAASAAALIVALGLWMFWPQDPFREIQQALADGKIDYALTLIDKHPQRERPRGKAMRARALLRRASPNRALVARMLQDATMVDPSLLNDREVISDLVASLDRRNAADTIDFIAVKVERRALPFLAAASGGNGYWLRWNSIKVLKKLGAEDQVDLVLAYIQDLRTGTCDLRKAAAKELAELGDRRALKPLREARERGMLENFCMFGTLDEAIRAIEKKG